MKAQFKVTVLLLTVLLPTFAAATYQIADPARGVPSAKGKHYLGYPARWSDAVRVQLFKGSLKGNVQRIAAQHGWQVNWQVKQKFAVLIETQLAGPDFVTVMNDLLSHYPVSTSYTFHPKHGANTLTVGPGH
jgi:hypothetical protein